MENYAIQVGKSVGSSLGGVSLKSWTSFTILGCHLLSILPSSIAETHGILQLIQRKSNHLALSSPLAVVNFLLVHCWLKTVENFPEIWVTRSLRKIHYQMDFWYYYWCWIIDIELWLRKKKGERAKTWANEEEWVNNLKKILLNWSCPVMILSRTNSLGITLQCYIGLYPWRKPSVFPPIHSHLHII